MICLLHFIPILILICVETISISQEDGEHVLKERKAPIPKTVSLDLLDQLEKAAQNEEERNRGLLPFQVPTEKACGEMEKPSYAKATCTSYPGKIVCQLGRYTFVINNGEHKMNPEIIERFAAMVYHRSQEGDSDFDVSVDIPVRINEDYFVPPNKLIETTTAHVEENRYPVFVECSPVPDDRKMCNPPYTPTEITYSCKRRELGYGGYGGGHEKRMVISVDREGTVSAGELVLPYNALIEQRKKRQKEKVNDKAELIRLTPSGTDNKLYTDVCSYQTKSWCPNFIGTDCPPSCRTENQTAGNDCAAVYAASPTSAIDMPPIAGLPLAPSGGNAPSAVIQSQKSQGASDSNSAQQEESLPVMKGNEAGLYAVSNLPPPEVRVYTDICVRSTDSPWCPQSKGEAIECAIPSCVTTVDECAPPTTKCRQRRERPKEKKPAGLNSRRLQNRIRISRKVGQKRIYSKRKRQAYVSRFHFQNPMSKKQNQGSTHSTSTTPSSSTTHYKTSAQRKNMPQCTVAPECTTTPQCTVAPECTTTPQCTVAPECTTTTQSTIPPECTTTPQSSDLTASTECIPLIQFSTLPECTPAPTTTECVRLKRLGYNRLPLFKREMRRRRIKPSHKQWPNMSRERYILE